MGFGVASDSGRVGKPPEKKIYQKFRNTGEFEEENLEISNENFKQIDSIDSIA
jgi:hypothetical protein